MLLNDAARGESTAASLADLVAAFDTRRALVGVVGLGYVGMPLALTAAKAGFRVIGFDINAPRVAQINCGESLITYIPGELFVGGGRGRPPRGDRRLRPP